jgi:hypothetical protein
MPGARRSGCSSPAAGSHGVSRRADKLVAFEKFVTFHGNID